MFNPVYAYRFSIHIDMVSMLLSILNAIYSGNMLDFSKYNTFPFLEISFKK